MKESELIAKTATEAACREVMKFHDQLNKPVPISLKSMIYTSILSSLEELIKEGV